MAAACIRACFIHLSRPPLLGARILMAAACILSHYHHHHLSCSAKDSYGSSEDSSELLVLPWVRILIAAVSILCTNTYHSCCCVDQSCLGPGLPRILMAAAAFWAASVIHPDHLLGEDSYGSSLHSELLLVLRWVRILIAAACIHLCSWGLLCQGFLWQQLHSLSAAAWHCAIIAAVLRRVVWDLCAKDSYGSSMHSSLLHCLTRPPLG